MIFAMVTGLYHQCPLPPTLNPPPRRGEGKGGGDAVRDFYATFRFNLLDPGLVTDDFQVRNGEPCRILMGDDDSQKEDLK
jgi:hypothetical protein